MNTRAVEIHDKGHYFVGLHTPMSDLRNTFTSIRSNNIAWNRCSTEAGKYSKISIYHAASAETLGNIYVTPNEKVKSVFEKINRSHKTLHENNK